MHLLWSVNLEMCGFYSKKAPPMSSPGGDTVECDPGFITNLLTTKSSGLINKADQGSFSEPIFNARLETHVTSAQTSVTC